MITKEELKTIVDSICQQAKNNGFDLKFVNKVSLASSVKILYFSIPKMKDDDYIKLHVRSDGSFFVRFKLTKFKEIIENDSKIPKLFTAADADNLETTNKIVNDFFKEYKKFAET